MVSIPTYPSGTVNRFQFPYLSFSRNKKSSIARSFLAAVVDITGQDTRLRRLVVGKHSSGRFAPIVGSKGGSHDHDLWMARTIIWRDGRRQRKYLDSTTPTAYNIMRAPSPGSLCCRVPQAPAMMVLAIIMSTANLNSQYFHRNDVYVALL